MPGLSKKHIWESKPTDICSMVTQQQRGFRFKKMGSESTIGRILISMNRYLNNKLIFGATSL